MTEWKECRLGDLITLEYGKSLQGYHDCQGVYPVYGTNGKIGYANSFLSPIPSIIIGRKGAYRGVHFSRVPFSVIDTAFYVKPKTTDIDLVFLYNFLLTQDINAMDSGSAIPSTDRYEIYEIGLALPSLPEQHAIASVLSSLDDKIDLLHRQNKTLEAMAETLFRQWFVEEAEVSYEKQIFLGDLIETVSITHTFPKPGIIFLNTSDIYLGDVLNTHYESVKNLPGQAKKSIKKDDILFSEIRPANGRYAYIDFEASDYVVSTKLMVLRSKGILSQAFVYFYLTNKKTTEWLQTLAEARSGTFPQITFDQLRDLEIKAPSDELLHAASRLCDGWLNKIKSNHAQIRILEKMRDTLLPKLMNGEVKCLNH
ncbi:MAG: hypothetical protein A2268_04080 [Candidatus Raymondbacteria bacterium RifOxyA12_full_50_37]|uniref:Type I restriction modification DNA specificity domain-containing protein n=1 Tax=Candidatus Raymondbacteria bacterium RIFOXYD12_FULL_49_13 TaxID=1817890 RepID=A0A1F7FB29_UNCRA|nr:MAG: hypothetical protein A2268_04080 [Candidatus Raymondbacteria bacterium RifOxyA12_full_50_37]OGJ92596.1 MAG: hypothetical protein A2248_05870 [Candidatus Raymondbacteria bacterium RIFOXYA2_FULL_49_16]OGJ92707.1 MAG: hypothetical protein A2350_16700 [Candidatus Raymondbacteria bacterium RifOxyB12_full_50_8]OGJ97950.1 MAG: hypothetical protein A2453_02895 [Candidatus Raymondbacteria bacterium RIFOXYC2_FULL_50_21]OGK02048.1 MAG: hypothetical protein A2487_01300 [Candidatus Raymondbacteria b